MSHIDPQTAAARHLPVLENHLCAVIQFGNEAFSEVHFQGDDDASLMALAFASRQIEHGRALLALRDNRDAELVARSMLEGTHLLKWAMKDDQRATDWRTFSAVENWRTMIDLNGTKDELTEAEKEPVLKNIKRFGPAFYNKDAREAVRTKQPLPADPYRKNWFGRQVKQIFEGPEGAKLYDQPYSFFSDYHHWSSNGVLRALDETEEGFRFLPVRPLDTAGAYASGIKCLIDTLEESLRKVAPDRLPELYKLRDAYNRDFDILNDGTGGLRAD